MAFPIVITGITPPTTQSQFSQGNGSDGGRAYNYTLVVQIPVPGISVNLNLIGDFILPALAEIRIPQAITWVLDNAVEIFQEVIDIAMELIRAIPEIVVSILVRIGPVAVINVQLIAEKQPFDVPTPVFILDLPNLAVGLNIDLSSLFPTPPPVVVRVPILVPRVSFPPLVITGGNVSVDGEVGVSESTLPAQILNPVRIPSL